MPRSAARCSSARTSAVSVEGVGRPRFVEAEDHAVLGAGLDHAVDQRIGLGQRHPVLGCEAIEIRLVPHRRRLWIEFE